MEPPLYQLIIGLGFPLALQVGIETDTLLLTFKLVPLTDRRKTHTSMLVKKCLIGFVPPYLFNYFKLNE